MVCLTYRWHRGLHWHGDPDWEHVNSGFFALDDVDTEARVHFEMAPGDTLLFHPLLVHGSGRNRTDGFRRAISSHYAAAECAYPEGVDQGGARRYRLIQGEIQPGGLLDNASAASGGLNG